MLQTVRIVNDRGGDLSLELDEVTNGIFVKEIEGLDPVKATIVTSGLAGADGLQYQASRRDARNITMKLGVDPGPAGTVRSIRSELLRVFMPKTSVTMYFTDGDPSNVSLGIFNPSLQISGRVEEADFPLFTDEPECNVSIMCFDPDFLETTLRGIGPANTTAGDGYITTDNYTGTVETGFTFSMTVDRYLPEFVIYHKPGDGSVRYMRFRQPLNNGDKIEIVSERGQKRATLTRAGVKTSVLYGVDPMSEWLNLFPGSNSFSVRADGPPIPYSITFRNKYGSL